ncbi:pyridoxamine 5'-phosphate oxidase family protein [Streptomyces sp. NPDC003077]|uniref:pyridoxamine 5'-phosphate oxidase family protein n=1 Tax=Streptomyces sp. NPDC003077 TaxID=3154443 RepID=UPI0033AFFD04
MDDLHRQEHQGHRPPTNLSAAVRQRLATERNVWLCTLRPDGSPHVTPVWFVFVRGTWWIGTDGGSVKARNVGNDPRVSLALEGGEAPVVAEGRARVWHAPTDDGASSSSASASNSRTGAGTGTGTDSRRPFPSDVVAAFMAKYDWDVRVPLRPASGRVLFEVPVDRWLLAGTAQ